MIRNMQRIFTQLVAILSVCSVAFLCLLSGMDSAPAADISAQFSITLNRLSGPFRITCEGRDVYVSFRGIAYSSDRREITLRDLHLDIPGLCTQDIRRLSLQVEPDVFPAFLGTTKLPGNVLPITRLILEGYHISTLTVPWNASGNIVVENLTLPSFFLFDLLSERHADIRLFPEKIAFSRLTADSLVFDREKQRTGSVRRLLMEDCTAGKLRTVRADQVVQEHGDIHLYADTVVLQDITLAHLRHMGQAESSLTEGKNRADSLADCAEKLFLSGHPVFERCSLTGLQAEIAGLSLTAHGLDVERYRERGIRAGVRDIRLQNAESTGIMLPPDASLTAELTLDGTDRTDGTERRYQLTSTLDLRRFGSVRASAQCLPARSALSGLAVTAEDRGALAWILLNITDVPDPSGKDPEAPEARPETSPGDTEGKRSSAAIRTFLQRPGTLRIQSRDGHLIQWDARDRLLKDPAGWFTIRAEEGQETLAEQIRRFRAQWKRTHQQVEPL